jgi:hypothetical protein
MSNSRRTLTGLVAIAFIAFVTGCAPAENNNTTAEGCAPADLQTLMAHGSSMMIQQTVKGTNQQSLTQLQKNLDSQHQMLSGPLQLSTA